MMAGKRQAKKGKSQRASKNPTVPVLLDGDSLREAEVLDAEETFLNAPEQDLSETEIEETLPHVQSDVFPSIEEVPEEHWEEEQRLGPRDIVPYDPLTAYLREINRYPRLSREEEFQLAIRYRENKDLNAAYKLVLGNLWLVVKIARDYEAAARSLLDLIQEGNIGLMEAVKNFDPSKEVRFPSYAVWWIKAYILRFVVANWRLIKIGTTQAQRKLFFNLKKEKERLEREGFSPMPKLIAQRLNVRESDVVEMEQRLGAPELSIDAPIIHEDTETNLGAMIPSGDLDAEEILSRRETKEQLLNGLDEFASTLNDKETVIFKERLVGEQKATLHELAERFSLSKERIRQIENRLKEKLKAFLVAKFGANVERMNFEP